MRLFFTPEAAADAACSAVQSRKSRPHSEMTPEKFPIDTAGKLCYIINSSGNDTGINTGTITEAIPALEEL